MEQETINDNVEPTTTEQPRKRLTEDEKTLLYRAGSIRRIKLKNFLTYSDSTRHLPLLNEPMKKFLTLSKLSVYNRYIAPKDVEFCPGPRLNVVIGPNGTGKSTILCAICLGLGGQPPLLGRADDVRIFIMNQQDVAEIEIELAPHHNTTTPSQSHVIRRVIDRTKGAVTGRGGGSSLYYINDTPVAVKVVQKLVKDTYHIAIDNLCTFLPQDRVGSFSGFDAQMLLSETQKSLSGTGHLYNEHLKLIQLEQDLLSSDSRVTSTEDELKRLQGENDKLESVKELMEKRQEYVEKIKLFQQKLAWVVFDNTRERALKLRVDKNALKSQVKAAQGDLKPLQEQIGEISNTIQKSIARSREFEQEVLNSRKAYDVGVRKAELCQDDVDSAVVSYTEIDTLQRRAEGEVEEKRLKVQSTEAVVGDYPPEEELKGTQKNHFQEMTETKKQMVQAKREAERKQMDFKGKRQEKEQLVRKFTKMQDDKARRNERIFQRDTKLRDTYEWVNQNRKMFRHSVLGPIVCEIATKTTNTAAYLEQHVANSVLKSFVVESREDYNLLYREVREKRGMSVNIQIVLHGKLNSVKRMYSDSRMEILKREHGVLGYLDESFEAPDAVLQALRDSSGVHSVLVGSSKTYQSLDQENLLDFLGKREDGRQGLQQTCIFASHQNKSFKYTSIISRYSGKASIRVDEINPARLLSPGVPPEEKERIENEIKNIENEIKILEPMMQEAGTEYESLQKSGQQISYKYKDASKALDELRSAKQKVTFAKRKLREAEQDASKDNANEKRQLMKVLKKQVSNYVLYLESASENFDSWIESESILTGIRVSEDDLHEQQTRLSHQLAEKEFQSKTLQEDYQRVSQEFDLTKKKLTTLKDRANDIANITGADGSDLKEALDKLPADETELQESIDDANERVNSIHENPEALRNYDAQKREIEKTKQELEQLNTTKEAKEYEISAKLNPWETALTDIVHKVNIKFAGYMTELGCAGEIRIAKGVVSEENFGNFKEWGMQIWVKFREKSDLQVLSAQVHSGGERSVSTIMYLMAMQDLMVSPFRCVDEINQGLDERNERLVFKRIVENSTLPAVNSNDPSSHCGQYFLITPKLLPNLTQMENEDVTVLCIFNGIHNFKHHNDWNADNFLQWRKRPLIQDDQEDYGSSPDTTTETRKKRKVT